MEEPRSSKSVVEALRSIRRDSLSSKHVSVSYGNGTLRVAEGTGEGILVCPLHSMATVSDRKKERKKKMIIFAFH